MSRRGHQEQAGTSREDFGIRSEGLCEVSCGEVVSGGCGSPLPLGEQYLLDAQRTLFKLRSPKWLCHSDARQVSDLPIKGPFQFHRSLTGEGRRPDEKEGLWPASPRLAAHQNGRAIAVVSQVC